ncbi:MAG: hypothetical protein QM589_14530 [Thermomicrobiales bacterium]
MRQTRLLLLSLVVVLASIELAMGGTITASSPAGDGCVIQNTSTTGTPVPADGCTVSAPWWWSSTCEQTPIQVTPWTPPKDLPDLDASYQSAPWLKLSSDQGDVIVMLWFGNRPVPVKRYADQHDFQNVAAITIVSPKPMTSVTLGLKSISAQMEYTLDATPNAEARSANVWDVEMINPPLAGCWDYTIKGTTQDGKTLSAPFTFVVTQ